MNTDDALEVAKLASMVGGQLKTIDKFSTERTSNPANKINIQNFITQVKNPRAFIPPANYLTQVPAGYAPPPPEEFVQSQVPDTSIGSLPPVSAPSLPTMIQQTNLQTVPVTTATILDPAPAHVAEKAINQTHYSSVLSISDVEIASILKSIDKTLADMLTYMKEKLSNE
jgi:hypothetical protein